MSSEIKYWQLDSAIVAQELKTSSQAGLSPAAAAQRLASFGLNEINQQRRRSVWQIFLSQFTSPLVLILIGASLISGYLGDVSSTIIIISIVLVSGILAFLQEYKSELALAKLQQKVSLQATVIRQGQTRRLPASQLVVGDLVDLSLGNVVPADLRLVEVENLLIDEAILTGESFPVEKNIAALPRTEYLPQALTNCAFAGTHVVQGLGRGLVVATAAQTELGKTAHLLEVKPQETEFQAGIRKFGNLLLRVIILFTVVVFAILTIFKKDPLAESLLFALAIAVGISPELLPIIITINLSRGAKKMSEQEVIVKRLMSIEDLGNAEIICTDKTGTLTEGVIAVGSCQNFSGVFDQQVLAYGLLCNANAVQKSTDGSPLDQAIIAYAKTKKFQPSLKAEQVFAFDFHRRRMSVVTKVDQRRILVCKGAVEEMLAAASQVVLNGQCVPLARQREALQQQFEELAARGQRLLLVGYRELNFEREPVITDEKDLILVGYFGFIDTAKNSAKQSLKTLAELGVEIKVLTGDSELASRYLCQQVGCQITGVISGQDLQKMSDEELGRAALEANLFVKITPEHKLRIIQTLKQAGKTVAFLGDGVNDAPALRAADVGISVDTAVDVAKEAADIILLKKSLRVLASGIEEGRKTFGNTLKYIFCTISSNYGNMFSVTGAALWLPYIPMLPAQILLLNFLSDFPMLAVSGDRVDQEYLRRPKHWDIKVIQHFMAHFGLLSSFFDFLTFVFLWFVVKASTATTSSLFQSAWFWESYLTEVLMIFIVRTRRWFWQSRPSRMLVVASLLTTVLVLWFIYSGINQLFSLTPLPLWILLSVTVIAVAYFAVVEIEKKRFYKKYEC